MARHLVSAVREPSTLSIDVSELLRRPGASLKFEVDCVLEGLSMPLSRVEEGSSLDVRLRLEALVDGIHASGTVRGVVERHCRRCLATLNGDVEVPFDELYLASSEETADDDEIREIVDGFLDLEPALRDVVLVNLPLNPLCRTDCKGLCPECGADRNEGDCGHRVERVDIRWEPLSGLKERLEHTEE